MGQIKSIMFSKLYYRMRKIEIHLVNKVWFNRLMIIEFNDFEK